MQEMKIYVGFSFLTKNPVDNTLSYMYAARDLTDEEHKATIQTHEGLSTFIDRFKGRTEKHFLETTFVSTREDSPFASSGIVPVKLVCAYIWIQK